MSTPSCTRVLAAAGARVSHQTPWRCQAAHEAQVTPVRGADATRTDEFLNPVDWKGEIRVFAHGAVVEGFTSMRVDQVADARIHGDLTDARIPRRACLRRSVPDPAE